MNRRRFLLTSLGGVLAAPRAAEVEAVVGTRSFQRGRAFARSGRVRSCGLAATA